jgi:hypothetical protein
MNVIEFMTRLGGETLNNKVRAMVDGKIVVLARMQGTEWEYTAEGQELANKHSNEIVAEAKATRTRKPKDVPVEPVAVELANVEPEL